MKPWLGLQDCARNRLAPNLSSIVERRVASAVDAIDISTILVNQNLHRCRQLPEDCQVQDSILVIVVSSSAQYALVCIEKNPDDLLLVIDDSHVKSIESLRI